MVVDMRSSELNQTNRLHYMDATRTFALLLGVMFHASLSFMPVFIGWAVMDINTSNVVSIMVLIAHSFRMELFFLIAGFFTFHTIRKKGVSLFIKSRLLRIGLPFVLGWLLLRPMLVSGWVMGSASMRGDIDYFAALTASIDDLLQLPQGLLIGTHLWFLYYLLVFSVCTLITVSIFKLLPEQFLTTVKRIKQLIICYKGHYVLIALLTCVCMWFMQHWTVDTPDKSLKLNLPVFFLYGTFFSLGAFLASSAEYLTKFTEITKTRLVICLLATGGSLVLAPFEMQGGHADYLWIKAAYIVCYGLMMWLLTMLTLGMARRLVQGSNAFITYMGQASYFVYLIHLPIVIWLQIAVAELTIAWPIKLFLVSIGTVSISVLIYDLAIRNSSIGNLLNGKKHPSGAIKFMKNWGAKVSG